MAHVDEFFAALEKEGLYNGSITIAGQEYNFPAKETAGTAAGNKSSVKFAGLLKYAALIIILVIAGFVLLHLSVRRGPGSTTQPLDDVEITGRSDKDSSAEIKESGDAGLKTGEREMAGMKFYPVNSGDYYFEYITGKIFLANLRSTDADIRLVINDIVDRINKQAKKNKLAASVLTPRFMINKHLVELWQDGYLEKWQIFVSGKGEVLLVKKTNSDFISLEQVSDWKSLSKNKKVFTRIILKKAED